MNERWPYIDSLYIQALPSSRRISQLTDILHASKFLFVYDTNLLLLQTVTTSSSCLGSENEGEEAMTRVCDCNEDESDVAAYVTCDDT